MQVQKNKIDDGSQNLQNPDENREKYEQNQCIGITRGGRNTKIHAVVDGIGYPIHIQLSSGNISNVSIAQEVLSHVMLVTPSHITTRVNPVPHGAGSSLS